MTLPPDLKATVFPDQATFRRWLEVQHATATELWVGYYKKGVAKSGMTYPEALDEALCFGWIDGIGRRIDDEVHANRFTPRRRGSTWSTTNVARVQELIRQGRVTPAGLRAFEARRANNTGIYSYENRPADLPAAYAGKLRANAAAWAWWKARPAGYRRSATWWVISAKREVTRERRLKQLIADSAAGRSIKPLSSGTDRP